MQFELPKDARQGVKKISVVRNLCQKVDKKIKTIQLELVLSLSITELYFYLNLGSKIETYFCLFLYFFYIVIYQAIVRPTDDCLVYFYYLFISQLWVFFVQL